jgi:acetyl esterase/lipase
MKHRLCVLLFALFVTVPARSGQVRVVADVDYVPSAEYPDKKDRLDIYVPEGAKMAPVIVSVHGGGLRAGDKTQQGFVGQRFASAGNVTVVVNHRLSPSVTHPAHIEDIATAVAWTKRNIARYGGDPDKLFVVGHSAGAYLTALLMLDPRYLAAHNLKPRDIRGAVPVSGFFYVDREGVAPDRPKDVWGTDAAVWRDASPAKYIRKDVPPLLLVYADGDDPWRRQQQQDFAEALRKAGDGDVETKLVTGRTHSTIWNKMKDGEEETSRAILDFVQRVLRAAPSQ